MSDMLSSEDDIADLKRQLAEAHAQNRKLENDLSGARNTATLSKFLCLILRHKPETIRLTLDGCGWASIDDIARLSGANGGPTFTAESILGIARDCHGRRFSVSDDNLRIRANQGHSIPINLGLEPVIPPPVLYHGTSVWSVVTIMAKGLSPMARQYVHLSTEAAKAKKVGSRHGKPAVLAINAREMSQIGYHFFVAENGVWLTERVPPEFITEES